MTKDDDPFLTTRQVGDFFAVEPDTVAQWIKDGKLEGTKLLGKRTHRNQWRVRKSWRDKLAQEMFGSSHEAR